MRFALNVLYIAELDRKLLIFIYSMSVSDMNGFLFLVQHTFFSHEFGLAVGPHKVKSYILRKNGQFEL